MKKQKFTALTFCLCLLLCGFMIFAPFYFVKQKIKPQEKTEDESKTFKGVITMWDYPHLDRQTGTSYGWLLSKIRCFEKEHPGVYVQVKAIDDENGPEQIQTSIQTKTTPDIAPIGGDTFFIKEGALECLNEYFSKQEIQSYKQDILKAVSYDGKIFGVPMMLDAYALLLNVDVFSEKGVILPKNGVWQDKTFKDCLKKLTSSENKNEETKHYGFQSYIGNNLEHLVGFFALDPKVLSKKEDGSYALEIGKASKGMKYLSDLKFSYGVTPKDFGENTQSQAKKMFLNKKVAVYPSNIGLINKVLQLNKGGKGFLYDIAYYPNEELKPHFYKKVLSYGILKQKDSKKREMCIELLKYLSQEEYQKDLKHLGLFPVRKSVKNLYTNDPILKKIEKNLAKAKLLRIDSLGKDSYEILQNQIRQVLLSKKSKENAIEDACKKQEYMNRVIKK